MNSKEREIKGTAVVITLYELYPEIVFYAEYTENNKLHLFFDGLQNLLEHDIIKIRESLEKYGCDVYISLSKMQVRIG